MARLKLTASASGSFDASITLQKDARVALDNARIEYEPGNGLPRLSIRASQNVTNPNIAKTVVLQVYWVARVEIFIFIYHNLYIRNHEVVLLLQHFHF